MLEFFMLLIKNISNPFVSPADKLHFFAISARAPQNCSNDSLSLCFLFNSLFLSNVTLLTNATDRFSKNSLKKIWRILTRVNIWPKIFFPSFPRAKKKIDRSFLSASSNLKRLKFFVIVFLFPKLSLYRHIYFVHGYSFPDGLVFGFLVIRFPTVAGVGGIVLSCLEGCLCRYIFLRLLPVEIDRSTPPRELVGPPYGFAKMKVYLSLLICYCLTAP